MTQIKLLEEVLDHIQEAVLVFNKYQKIVYYNSKLLSITNLNREDIENKVIQVFIRN